MLEDELTVCDLTENEDREEIEIDTLVVDGEAVSRDVSSNNDHWILYVNTIQFLKVRRELHDNQIRYLLHVPYLHMRFTVTPNAKTTFQQSAI